MADTFRVNQGPVCRPPEGWADVYANVRKACRTAGYIWPRIRVYFREWITDADSGDPIYGYTQITRTMTTIHLSYVLGVGTSLTELLIHELAHAITFAIEGDDHPDAHSDVWGVTYARLYRATHD